MPEMLTAPLVEVSAPPERVTLPLTVKANVAFARLPEDTVRDEAVKAPPCVIVPVTVRVAKACDAPGVTVLEVPVRVTDEDVLVNEVADDVSQDPATLRVAEAKVIVAAPLDVRFPLNVAVDEVRVSVADHVMSDVRVVVMPALTVRLDSVVGTFTVPPDPATTTVDVPCVNVPALVSIEVTVIVLPRAVKRPPEPIVAVVTVIAKFETDVSRVVVEDPSLTCTVPAFKPRVAIVKVWAVPEEDVNATVANSLPLRFAPANVIVPPVAEVNVTEPDPADQEAEVELSVHVPANVHGAPPKLK